MIICCGEALVDMIPTADKASLLPVSGGAVFNTAVSLGRLDVNVGFVSGLSTDLFGKQLGADLTKSNVDTSLIVWSDLPTTLAFVELTNGHATYTFYDENTAGRSLSPDILVDIPSQVQALYFGGISLISEPCADFYEALAVRESANRVIMIDPNIRTSFIKDEARYRRRLNNMIQHSDIVKVSDEDLDWIVQGDASLEDKVKILHQMGAKIVVLTKGKDGSSAWLFGTRYVEAPAVIAEVVDTVGAGDTFNSGVLAQLFEMGLLSKDALSGITDAQMIEALNKGAKVAAITVSRSGSDSPWAHELSD